MQGLEQPPPPPQPQHQPPAGAAAAAAPRPRPTWQAHVRARGEVVAFRAELARVERLACEYPELGSAMRHLARQQETDLLVAEALRQLRLVTAQVPGGALLGGLPAAPTPPPPPPVAAAGGEGGARLQQMVQ